MKNPTVLKVCKSEGINCWMTLAASLLRLFRDWKQPEDYNKEHSDNPTKSIIRTETIQQILTNPNDGRTDYKVFERIIRAPLSKTKVFRSDWASKTSSLYVYPIIASGQEDLQKFVNKRIKELYEDGTLGKLSQEFLAVLTCQMQDIARNPIKFGLHLLTRLDTRNTIRAGELYFPSPPLSAVG